MKNHKKYVTANRLSFLFFGLYFLNYLILPAVTRDPKNFVFLSLPLIFLIALLVNLALKRKKIKAASLSKVTKASAFFNVLFNGADAVPTSLYAGTADWNKNIEEILKYPSIMPAWLFVAIYITPIANVSFYALLDDSPNCINPWVLLTFSLTGVLFLVLGQISSTRALIYSGEKQVAKKSWKSIIIITIVTVIIMGLVGGPVLYEEIKMRMARQEFEEHVRNMDEALND